MMMNIIKRINNKGIERDGNHKGQQGQSLVEMAVMMVLLLIIMGGVLDLGRMYFTYLALQNAAGEGAAYGAINPEWVDSSDNADPNNITYRVQSESTGNLIDWSATTVVVQVPAISGGQPVTVTVSYDYEVITPMMQVITGDEVTLKATDTQLIFLDENE
jgi:Flp pilus assembly protein TadG